jgi:hypothetical protein
MAANSSTDKFRREPEESHGDSLAGGRRGGEDVPAWELLEAGRYMPRRIRGSFRGRELG